MTVRQCIAMGDGGLDGSNPYMDLYILAQSQKEKPKVCFLGTASGDNTGLIKFFHRIFDRYPCKPSSLSLFNPHTPDIADFIKSQDVIYVGGGQSKSMLGVWREWGMDKILREAYEGGTILSGGSAGSVCWFDQCITDSIPGSLTVMNCIGILPFSNCPHFASWARRTSYSKFIRSGEIKAGYAADDYAGLHFVNESFLRGVSNRPHAKTFNLFLEGKELIQKRLKTYWLGMREYQEEFIFNSPMFDARKREQEERAQEDEPESNPSKPLDSSS